MLAFDDEASAGALCADVGRDSKREAAEVGVRVDSPFSSLIDKAGEEGSGGDVVTARSPSRARRFNRIYVA